MSADEPTLGEIGRSLLRIEATLNDKLTGQGQRITDHEDRIRKVERWMYAVPPAIVLAVASIAKDLLAAR